MILNKQTEAIFLEALNTQIEAKFSGAMLGEPCRSPWGNRAKKQENRFALLCFAREEGGGALGGTARGAQHCPAPLARRVRTLLGKPS